MSKLTIRPAGGEMSMPLTIQQRMALICKNVEPRGKRVLDCGCGKGHYVIAFLDRGADAWGLEYEASKVAEYKQLHPDLSEHVSQGDIEKMDYPDNSFDLVLLNEVLEHVPDDMVALREIYRILKPQGSLFMFTPNRFHPFERHGVYWKRTNKLLNRYMPFIPYVPVQVGRNFFTYWARNYWPVELRRMVTAAGYKISETGYVWPMYENIDKRQPAWLTVAKNIVRVLSLTAEKTPLIRSLGASQFIRALKVC